MNKHERELLEYAREHKEKLEPDKFKSWLKGFRSVGTETDRLNEEFERLLKGTNGGT